MSQMILFAVHCLDYEHVTVVAARTRLAARLRVQEASGVPLSRLAAAPEPDLGLDGVPTYRKFRCGRVAVEVAWSPRARVWHAGLAFEGQPRRYVEVGERGNGHGREEAREVARCAVMTLLNADMLDEGWMLWEGAAGAPQLNMVEEGGR